MSRRADRRRLEIQHALLAGPALPSELARTLGCWRMLVRADLAALENAGIVVTQWTQRPGWPEGAVVAAYRLPTLAEQGAREGRQEAIVRRVRAALRALAENVEPGDGSAR